MTKSAHLLISGLLGLHKQALQSVDTMHEKELAAAGAPTASQKNYTTARNRNLNTLWNPLMWGHFGQIAKTDMAMEDTRQKYLEYLQWQKNRRAAAQQKIWDQQREEYLKQKQAQ